MSQIWTTTKLQKLYNLKRALLWKDKILHKVTGHIKSLKINDAQDHRAKNPVQLHDTGEVVTKIG